LTVRRHARGVSGAGSDGFSAFSAAASNDQPDCAAHYAWTASSILFENYTQACHGRIG
jgi:hypothetical protein